MEWKDKIRFETSGKIFPFARAASKNQREEVDEVNETR